MANIDKRIHKHDVGISDILRREQFEDFLKWHIAEGKAEAVREREQQQKEAEDADTKRS